MRDDGQNPIILDAGDMFFSTTSLNKNNLESENTGARPCSLDMKRLVADGLNIGKYELLGGITYLKSLEQKHPKIPFISANIRDKKTEDLIFSPLQNTKKENLSIGIIGVTNMVPDTMESVIVDDYVQAGNDYIKKISKDVDIIVMLVNSARNTHQSLPKTLKKQILFLLVAVRIGQTLQPRKRTEGHFFILMENRVSI